MLKTNLDVVLRNCWLSVCDGGTGLGQIFQSFKVFSRHQADIGLLVSAASLNLGTRTRWGHGKETKGDTAKTKSESKLTQASSSEGSHSSSS